MPDLGSLFTLSYGAVGSGSLNVVTVSDPDAVVARAVGSLITVDYGEDPGSVTFAFPSTLTAKIVSDISGQLNYIFSEPNPGDLGWMTITAKGIVGLADSADDGGVPDYIPVAGFATLTPTLSQPIRIIPTGQFLAVASVTATFDSDGELSFDGQKKLRVIAPKWTGLSKTDWSWAVEVRPGPGQSWSPFTTTVTGAPGSTVDLASGL